MSTHFPKVTGDRLCAILPPTMAVCLWFLHIIRGVLTERRDSATAGAKALQ